MVVGDILQVPTIIENLSSYPLHNVTLSISTHNRCIQVLSNDSNSIDDNTVVIGTLPPRESRTIYWTMKATAVGDANITTTLNSPLFSEVSGLQKPLRVNPPGSPNITLYR